MKIDEGKSKPWIAYAEGIFKDVNEAQLSEGYLDSLTFIGRYTSRAKAEKSQKRYYARYDEKRLALASKEQKALKAKEASNRIHYILTSGLHDCIPNVCESYDSFESAVDGAISIYENSDSGWLSDNQRAELKVTGYTELDLTGQSNEYIDISPCYCDNPDDHND